MRQHQESLRDVEDVPPGGLAYVAEPATPEPSLSFPSEDGRRIRNYDELEGAVGRAVFFRPHRHAAAELAPLACTVEVEAETGPVCCPLHDVSQNGAAFRWTGAAAPRPGQRLRAALRFDEHEAFRGELAVGSVRELDGAVLVGASFRDFLLDTDEIVQLRDVAVWRAASTPAAAPAWKVEGGERFVALVSELRLLLEDAKRELGALEATLPWNVLHGPPGPARAALLSHLLATFARPAVALSEEIDRALREVPGAHANAAAREWSMRQVHALLMESPGCARCREKPFGYPGDYEVMNFLYERHFEGPTLFARAITLAFCHSRPGTAVRTRKDLVRRELETLLVRNAGSDRPVRVLSIAAGPARELQDLLEGLEELPVPMEIVLFEQDKGALAHAFRRLRALVDQRFPGQVRLTFLNESVKRLLRDGSLFADLAPFDLVYSCGLFDYLQARTASILVRRLAGATARGGKVLFANMVDNPGRWLMEFHYDWPLIYRTRDQLLDIGRRAVPGAHLRILEEATGANPFCELLLP